MLSGGGGGGVDSFTRINNMEYVTCYFGFRIFRHFSLTGPLLAKLK